mmetsp:Transcript_41646/g.88782  ORF Transcript_41646/g.88782 Transcript_41646/m.88782 type:complete len:383 (-) Transcript_41646:462-1610(-)
MASMNTTKRKSRRIRLAHHLRIRSCCKVIAKAPTALPTGILFTDARSRVATADAKRIEGCLLLFGFLLLHRLLFILQTLHHIQHFILDVTDLQPLLTVGIHGPLLAPDALLVRRVGLGPKALAILGQGRCGLRWRRRQSELHGLDPVEAIPVRLGLGLALFGAGPYGQAAQCRQLPTNAHTTIGAILSLAAMPRIGYQAIVQVALVGVGILSQEAAERLQYSLREDNDHHFPDEQPLDVRDVGSIELVSDEHLVVGLAFFRALPLALEATLQFGHGLVRLTGTAFREFVVAGRVVLVGEPELHLFLPQALLQAACLERQALGPGGHVHVVNEMGIAEDARLLDEQFAEDRSANAAGQYGDAVDSKVLEGTMHDRRAVLHPRP